MLIASVPRSRIHREPQGKSLGLRNCALRVSAWLISVAMLLTFVEPDRKDEVKPQRAERRVSMKPSTGG